MDFKQQRMQRTELDRLATMATAAASAFRERCKTQFREKPSGRESSKAHNAFIAFRMLPYGSAGTTKRSLEMAMEASYALNPESGKPNPNQFRKWFLKYSWRARAKGFDYFTTWWDLESLATICRTLPACYPGEESETQLVVDFLRRSINRICTRGEAIALASEG